MASLSSVPYASPETPDETIQRLTAELRQARDQQMATSEIPETINRSPGDLALVFDAILEKARIVCGFAQGSLNVYDDDYFRGDARNPRCVRRGAAPTAPLGSSGALLARERIVHIPDLLAEEVPPDDPVYRAAIELGGIRTVVFVPLRNETMR
jgi:hypothetical protein